MLSINGGYTILSLSLNKLRAMYMFLWVCLCVWLCVFLYYLKNPSSQVNKLRGTFNLKCSKLYRHNLQRLVNSFCFLSVGKNMKLCQLKQLEKISAKCRDMGKFLNRNFIRIWYITKVMRTISKWFQDH